MKTVMFCGHRDELFTQEQKDWLIKTTEQLILEGATVFYLGGYGDFDSLAKKTVLELKKKYPQIHPVQVLAYLDKKEEFPTEIETVYPPLEKVPKKYAILRRNQWMVENSDVIISAVRYGWGGAQKTLDYAKKKEKMIFSYTE